MLDLIGIIVCKVFCHICIVLCLSEVSYVFRFGYLVYQWGGLCLVSYLALYGVYDLLLLLICWTFLLGYVDDWWCMNSLFMECYMSCWCLQICDFWLRSGWSFLCFGCNDCLNYLFLFAFVGFFLNVMLVLDVWCVCYNVSYSKSGVEKLHYHVWWLL